ncbi:MAG: glycosyltransferase [Candidatus Margulisiibacteriota bacterium]
MKIAIVHDFLNQFGGAERVVEALHEVFPDAPIYTSIYDENALPTAFKQMDIRTSFMQKIPFISAMFRYYFFLYPLAFNSFDLSEYDVILSSSSAFAKGIRKAPGQLHICYCYTPMRFAWRYEDYVKKARIPEYQKYFLPYLLEPIRDWDLKNSESVDHFVAISKFVAHRIRKIYKRESDIIYPPVDTDNFRILDNDKDYFLVVSRLVSYKRVDLVVDAFNELGFPLFIIGDGPERKELEKKSQENIRFLGKLSDQDLSKYVAECRALIFPGEEDFGITPLEAMACGRPVIAYRAGGAEETVNEPETGMFFDRQEPEELANAVKKFVFECYDKRKIRQHAMAFDRKNFKKLIWEYVNEKFEKRD